MTDWNKIVRGTSDSALAQIYGSSTFPQEAIWAAGAELTRRSDPECDRVSYLDQWRAELEFGLRDIYTFDELWRLACEEMTSFADASLRHRARPRWSDQG